MYKPFIIKVTRVQFMVTQALLLCWYSTAMRHMDQVYTDAPFRLVVLGSLSV